MDTITKLEIGRRLRRRRENAGYTVINDRGSAAAPAPRHTVCAMSAGIMQARLSARKYSL